MNLENVMLWQISQAKTGQILCDATYMTYLEQSNPQRQKTEQQLLGAWERSKGKLMFNRHRVSENALEINGGYGCTITWMYLMPLNCAFKNG